MKSHIHSATSSLGEVAVFAWSLLELLLTRVFPLLGFLTAHFLLQFFRLVASVFSHGAAATRRHRWLPRLSVEDEQQEQQRRGHLQFYQRTASSCIDEILSDFDQQQQQQQQQQPPSPAAAELDELRSPRISEQHVKEAVPPSDLQRDESVLADSASVKKVEGPEAQLVGPEDLKQANGMPASIEQPAGLDRSDVSAAHGTPGGKQEAISNRRVEKELSVAADSLPRVNVEEAVLPSKEKPDTKENQVNSSGVAESGPLDKEKPDTKENQVNSSGLAESGPLDKESSKGVRPSDGEVDQIRKNGSIRRRGIIPRVLPPSLSQIKRTLMQRSRRAWSPASATPKPSSSSPSPNSKRYNPRTRKSSPSYDNFVRAFRKHFLLDSA